MGHVVLAAKIACSLALMVSLMVGVGSDCVFKRECGCVI